MEIIDKNLDGGKAFDWGKTSSDYAKYRDIYPQEFYDKIVSRNLCIDGQTVLDLGTGTGVIPRNMYPYGAKWIGTDISENQIEQAKLLSQGLDIEYYARSAEDIDFPEKSFDVITACQCFWYFDHEKIMPSLHKLLKNDGRILVLYMAWLPFEDKIAGESEKLVLKYSPNWSGAGETMHSIFLPDCYNDKFELVYHDEYKLNVHFTRDSWNGRMKACRGVGASLSESEIASWEKEHMELLESIAPEEFDILHYAAIAELKKR
ncbi:MAG: class I SAM-dependent methyltransferase [Lachnospiraceae bacterium]|nr:class I SAM-dependent methyltransferase [Lachnospiraceae bacterium]